MPTATVYSRGRITLPRETRRELGIGPGTKLAFIENADDETVIKPMHLDIRDGHHNSKSEVLREGERPVQDREARLAALDAAIVQGLADAEAGRTQPAEAVFARLERKYWSMVTPPA